MKRTWIVKFEIFGKRLMTRVDAANRADAIEAVKARALGSFQTHSAKPEDDGMEDRLRRFFGGFNNGH